MLVQLFGRKFARSSTLYCCNEDYRDRGKTGNSFDDQDLFVAKEDVSIADLLLETLDLFHKHFGWVGQHIYVHNAVVMPIHNTRAPAV